MENVKRDKFGQEASVGDIIIYAICSEVKKAYILGFTPMGIYISNSVYDSIEKHDCKKYYRYLSYAVIEKNTIIPKALEKYCYFHQMEK